jgi:hypothetical protein
VKDQGIVIEALYEAGQIIAEYLEPASRNAEATVNRLIQTLDDERLGSAVERLNRGLSDEHDTDLSLKHIAVRVVFYLAVTALVGLTGYLVVGWLAHLRPYRAVPLGDRA